MMVKSKREVITIRCLSVDIDSGAGST
jgi:hypothetical protein